MRAATRVVLWRALYIAIRKDAEAVLRLMNATGRLEVDRPLCSTTAITRRSKSPVLRLMNSTGRLVVDRLLCSTAAMTLCSRVSSSSARILDLSSSVRARVRCRSSLEFSSAILKVRHLREVNLRPSNS